MQLSQIPRVGATFDDANLLPSAGLVPVMRLARRAGLGSLVSRIVTVPGGAGANAAAKVASIVAGMLTGADSIADGHVRQLGAVAAGFLVALAQLVPLLTGHDDHRDAVTWLDTDDTMRETHGYAKQGVGYGYNKVKGLNALLGIVSTAVSAPVIVAHRLRQGTVSSARGAGKFLADAIAATRRVGAGPVIRCRLDSAFYNHSVVAAIRKARAQFSITARMDKAVQKAISSIPENAWVSIKYPTAIYDQDEQRWISDAQVAETTYTAFTSKARKHRVTARLIVRRVKRLNPKTAPPGQDELFSVYRYHAVFTDSTEPMLLAEAHHRDHAIIEQVIADLKSSALKHFPSASFNANGAWLACAVMAYNLSRAAGVLAGGKLRKARTATIRTTLINIPARAAFSAGTYTLHLPANSRRETLFMTMFDDIQAPPQAA